MANVKKNMSEKAKMNALKNILEVSAPKRTQKTKQDCVKSEPNTKAKPLLRFTLRIPRRLSERLEKLIQEHPTKISMNQYILQCIAKVF